jgi:hypothetical protein
MSERGLEQFFTIGSEEKRTHGVSPQFGRKRIGQFGIGKFSALALCDEFLVESVKGKNKYTVIFNRSSWASDENWDLPIKKEAASALDEEGTRIVLNKLTKKISPSEAEKYLKQSVPLRVKKFSVYLNNKKISAKTVAGKIIAISIKTMYGLIEGEIVVAINPRDVDEPGVECRVKQALIKREFFGLDRKYKHGINRIAGSVNADFLPLIAARSDFVIDSAEYKLFFQLMRERLDKVLKEFNQKSEIKNLQKINKELQEIMKHIKDALALNPDFVPQGKAVARLKKEGRKKMAAASAIIKNDENKKEEEGGVEEENIKDETTKAKEENKKEKERFIQYPSYALNNAGNRLDEKASHHRLRGVQLAGKLLKDALCG